MNKSTAFVFACMVLVSGCTNGEQTKIKEAIRDVIVDRDSLKVEEMVLDEDSDVACATLRAKNGFGGYSTASAVLYKLPNGDWKVKSLENNSPEYVCSTFFAVLEFQDKKALMKSMLSTVSNSEINEGDNLYQKINEAIAHFDKLIKEVKDLIRK